MNFLETVRSVCSTFADDGVAAIEIAHGENILEMEANHAFFADFFQAFDGLEIRARPLADIAAGSDV